MLKAPHLKLSSSHLKLKARQIKLKVNLKKDRKYNLQTLLLSPFMTYHWVFNKSIMTGVFRGAGTACPSRAHAFTTFFVKLFFLNLLVCVVFYWHVTKSIKSPLFSNVFIMSLRHLVFNTVRCPLFSRRTNKSKADDKLYWLRSLIHEGGEA
jgi:hypothetical protein